MANEQQQDKPAAQPQEQAQDQPVTYIVNGVEVDANGQPVKKDKK